MRRLHLFEFCDQAWLPTTVRQLLTGSLEFGITRFGFYDRAAPLVSELLEDSGRTQIVDLCSGGGGPWLRMAERLREHGRELEVVLTDKLVHHDARRRIEAGEQRWLRYHDASVDAAAVPASLPGVRTLFTSFHHFRPSQARALLVDAARSREPIAVFEFTERSVVSCIAACIVPWAMLVTTPFMRPLTPARLLLTYVLPLVPLLSLWDGVVSSLRSYTPRELEAMGHEASSTEMHWRSGQLRGGLGTPPITFLVGVPTRDCDPERTLERLRG